MRSVGPSVAALLPIVALALVMALPTGVVGTAPPAPAAASIAPAVTVVPHPSTAHPAAGAGKGVFFTNTPIPLPTKRTCWTPGACANITNEPSINYTSTGVLAMAYTAVTNASPCANVSNYAGSEVGFVASTDLGATWSTPIYLGNTNCSLASQYPSAWEPSLTSLANGTLAMVFIEYNLSGNLNGLNAIPDSNELNTPTSRLVFTESYDGGTQWTPPVALNTSSSNASSVEMWSPERPWISAMGQTIYVTWENFTKSNLYPAWYYPSLNGAGSIGSNLVVSKTGGASWGAPMQLPVTPGLYYPYYEHVAMNPTVLASPNGSVYVAYTTNISDWIACGAGRCIQNPADTGDVVVGESMDNGSTFRWSTVAHAMALVFQWDSFLDPSPQLAVNPANGQIYVTFSGGVPGTYCFVGTAGLCGTGADASGVYFANSSNDGRNWSTAHLVDPSLSFASGGYPNATYNPSLTVDTAGVVHLELTSVGYGQCPGVCAFQRQLYYNSTDNGTTFAGGYILSGNYTNDPYEWDGEYDTMAHAGGHVWIAYVQDLCPAWSSAPCYMFGSSSGRAQVTVARPFLGAGVFLNFTETGIPAGTVWTANVLGNLRSAIAPTPLSVSGVPTGQVLNWTLAWANVSYGDAYAPTSPGAVGSALTGNTTIALTYSQWVEVTVRTLPMWNPCYSVCLNWATTGLGTSWVPVGTSMSASVSPVTVSCASYCDYVNATYVGWTGTGNGSVTTSADAIGFTANGAVNETANFVPNFVCEGGGSYVQCSGNGTYPIQFNETGLPSGTKWSVTADGITANSTTKTLTMEVPNGTVAWTAYALPGSSGHTWVATSSQPSEVQTPYTQYVDLTYAQVSTSTQNFSVQFNALGLPEGLPWTANFSGTLRTFDSPNASTVLPAGSYTLTFPSLNSENGTEFAASSILYDPWLEGAASRSGTNSLTLTVGGPGQIFVQFGTSVRVEVQSGGNGTATPALQWVTPGSAVVLHETPDAGYLFAGWVGHGPGATGTGQEFSASPTIFPTGPVTEIATFVPVAVGSYTASVSLLGAPTNASVTVAIGNHSARGNSSAFSIPDIPAGWYPLSVPTVYEDQGQTELTLAGAAVTGGTLYPNGTLYVVQNVTLTLRLDAKYLVTVAATGPGTTQTSPGSAFDLVGSSASYLAVPTGTARFLGWTGTGNGSYSGTRAYANFTVGGPISEVATFAPALPPAQYPLTVRETGLPQGVGWAISLAGLGASGTGSSVAVSALAGPYNLTVPVAAGLTSGTQYVSNWTAGDTVTIQAPGTTIDVRFTPQYAVTVSASSGGTVSPTGTTWYANGASVALSATPANGEVFLGWAGSGSSSYSGSNASAPLTITGPTTEVGAFGPAPPSGSSGGGGGSSSTTGLLIAIGAFAALAVVGLAVGVLLGRRARPPRSGPTSEPEPVEAAPYDESVPSEVTYGETPAGPDGPAE